MDRRLRAGLARGETPDQLAAIFALSPGAVRWRVRTNGASLRDGWYSPTEVARLLGVSWRRVRSWIASGWLLVEAHGRRWRRVTCTELERFVGSYGGRAFDAHGVTDPKLRRLAEVSQLRHLRRVE